MRLAASLRLRIGDRWRRASAVGTTFFLTATLGGVAAPAETPGHPAPGPGGHGSAAGATVRSPYAAQPDARDTGLLADEVEALTKAAGMAMALPAELNGYPGPRHLLDAASAGQLELRPEQREAIQRIYDRMLGAAKAKGLEVLQAEANLATQFRHAHIDEATLRDLVDRIGRSRADLRFIHLRTHLETKPLLTAEQIARYNALRGYEAGGGASHQHGN